ncbi:hypothetical protein [Azohydromonas lata]|uniref:hypothetical protein n=1 Tax=Azohydromonas lata TaxID=45677 RepID=UPI00082A82D4|nr:hypothetical protein [Azohydromonas lata]
MTEPSPASSGCSRPFRVFLSLALAALVAGWSALRLNGLHGVLPSLTTLAAAGAAGAMAWRLAARFLLFFVLAMAPALVLLALLSHWLP